MEHFKQDWKSKNEEKRIKWIESSNFEGFTDSEDPSILEDLVRNDESGFVRKAALRKIKNNELLIEIAKNDKDEHVRVAAIIEIDDKNIIKNLADNDRSDYVKKMAYKLLNP